MNISNFKENLDYLSYCGVCLNAEESALIENSLIILQSENKLKEMFFWGRINGVHHDLYIAYGYDKNCLTGCKFFCSRNGFDWVLLPEAQPDNEKIVLLNYNLFQGDLTYVEEVLTISNFMKENSPPPDESQMSKELSRLKEEDRLTSTVNMILSESAIVPRGGLHERADGVVAYSSFFHGLTHMEATDLNNYQLLRKPKGQRNANLLKRPDYNYSTDVFDTIGSIAPEGQSFSLNIDNDNGLATVRSLYWPGMVFYHKLGSNAHGFCYNGNGIRNQDLLFML